VLKMVVKAKYDRSVIFGLSDLLWLIDYTRP